MHKLPATGGLMPPNQINIAALEHLITLIITFAYDEYQ